MEHNESEIMVMGEEHDAHNLIENIYKLAALGSVYTDKTIRLVCNTLAAEISRGNMEDNERELIQYILNWLRADR